MSKNSITEWLKGILAGIAIAIGGTVYLSTDNVYIGSILFCIGLLTICTMNLSLYTGKIGYLAISHTQTDVLHIFQCLFSNIISVFIFGNMMAISNPKIVSIAQDLCQIKLEIPLYSAFIKAFMCGILMYIAVWIYKEHKSVIGLFVAVPTFVIAGFEHSIADLFYFTVGNALNANGIIFITVVLLGNTVGSISFALTQHFAIKNNKS